jgi:histidinol phosphatase-like PHP family hydrolase
MSVVPESYTRELGVAARETNTAIEINGYANLGNPAFSESYVSQYIDYLSILAGEGVTFSLASDAHQIGWLAKVQNSWQVAEKLNIPAELIWHPAKEPAYVP